MNKKKKKTIPELLANNNYILETKFFQKYNIRIETKNISSFQSTLSSWKNKKKTFKNNRYFKFYRKYKWKYKNRNILSTITF